jgi:hypothetical protein
VASWPVLISACVIFSLLIMNGSGMEYPVELLQLQDNGDLIILLC